MCQNTKAALEADCIKHWGVVDRTKKHIFDQNMQPLLSFWDFQRASDEMKAYVAHKLILDCTPRVGSYWDNGDMHGFIHKFAHDIAWSRGIFDDRRTKALRSALLLITNKRAFGERPSNDINIILAGGAAPASIYLLAQIEFLLRKRSRYLNELGEVIRNIPIQLRKKVKIPNEKDLTKNPRYRINQIKKAFHLFIYRNTDEPAPMFRHLQSMIIIDERLNLIRNSTMHGPLADPASEGPFYALVLAMFYYNEIV